MNPELFKSLGNSRVAEQIFLLLKMKFDAWNSLEEKASFNENNERNMSCNPRNIFILLVSYLINTAIVRYPIVVMIRKRW